MDFASLADQPNGHTLSSMMPVQMGDPAMAFSVRCGLNPRGIQRQPSTLSCCKKSSPEPGKSKPLVELRDLKYTVPLNRAARVLTGANFAVRPHEFVVVVGENGAGKSTREFYFLPPFEAER
jgi:ABC-type multidrug transport system fused ATPase/permease subunit